MTEQEYKLQILILQTKVEKLEAQVEKLEFQTGFWEEAYYRERNENYIPQLLASDVDVTVGE